MIHWEHLLEMLCDQPDDFVSLIVAIHVVDFFEIVQINEQDGEVIASHFLFDVFQKCPVVRESSEQVFEEKCLKFFFCFPNGPDVRKNGDMSLTHALCIQQGRDRQQNGQKGLLFA